jgi:hypothetical protein
MPFGLAKVNNISRVITSTGTRVYVVPEVYGDAKISTAQSKFGSSSAIFDGTGDGIRYNDSKFTLGTGDFTIEMWIRVSSLASQRQIYDQRSGTTSAVVPTLLVDTSGALIYVANGANRITSSSSAISTNTWYHIAVSRATGSTRMFIDGTQVGSTYTDSNNYIAQTVNIGSSGTGADGGFTNVFTGHIDELRVSNTARYTSAFTPSTEQFKNDANTLLLLHFEGLNDSRVFEDDRDFAALNRTRNGGRIEFSSGAKLTTTFKKFGSSSLDVSTVGYVSIDNFNFGNIAGNYTIEGWIMIPSATSGQKRLISMSRGKVFGSTASGFIDLRPQASNVYDIEYAVATSSVRENFNTNATQTFSYGTWYHWAWVRYSTGVINIFLNGNRRSNQNTSITYPFENVTGTLNINYGGNLIYLDEIRFSRVARYSNASTYTIPTAAFTNDSDTDLLLHFDGADQDTTTWDDNA